MREVLVIGVIGVVGLTIPAFGGPLQREHVDHQADWVLHVDFERLASSRLGGFLSEQLNAEFEIEDHDEAGQAETHVHKDVTVVKEGEPEGRHELRIGIGGHEAEGLVHGHRNEFKEMSGLFGFDPMTDLKSLTVYGQGDDDDDMILVMHTTNAVEEVFDNIKQHDDSLTIAVREGYRLLTWDKHNGGGIDHGGFAIVRPTHAGASDRTVIIAESLQRVMQAMSVIDGQSPSLTEGGARLVAMPTNGSILHLEAWSLGFLGETGPESVVLDKAQSATLDIAEINDQFNINAAVTFLNESDAQDIFALGQGLMAAARIGIRHDPEMKPVLPIINAIQMNLQNSTMHLSASWPTDLILELVEEHEEE